MVAAPRPGLEAARIRRSRVFGARCLLVVLCAVLLPGMAGCSPARSTLRPPYRLDGASYTAAELGEEAVQRCLADGRDPSALPPRAFTTDGCTLVSGGASTGCCIEHDMAYWCGGEARLRIAADRRLRQCVAAHNGRFAATAAYVSVRLGGSRWLPFPWRWGYGFDWPVAAHVPLPSRPAGDAVGPKAMEHGIVALPANARRR